MSDVRIVVETPLASGDTSVLLGNGDVVTGARNFETFFRKIKNGVIPADIKVVNNVVFATGTITSTGSASNGETMTLANVTLTAKTSGADPTAGEFDISATPTTQAANIALAINSDTDFAGIVTAKSALGVVTVTSVVPGLIGNGLDLTESLTNVTVAAFSGGNEGTSADIKVSY